MVYLDNSATTKVFKESIEKMKEVMENIYGNPSSLHNFGFLAEKEISNAREIIAVSLGATPKEIYFTSGGTEANNLAILGSADKYKKNKNKIIMSSLEHPSVLECGKLLKEKGFDVVFLNSENEESLLSHLKEEIDDNTLLVSIILSNNETGQVMPLEKVKDIIKGYDCLFHIDFVGGYLKMPFSVSKYGVDLVTISSHKVNGPKGVGALYIKKGVKINPILIGGDQQEKIRPGTENVPGIVGFAEAVRINYENIRQNYNHFKKLKEYLISKIENNEKIVINSIDTENRKFNFHVINISLLGLKSETVLHFLEGQEIYVSSGSACHSTKNSKSHVLKGMGHIDKIIDSAIRVSFSYDTTLEDIDKLVEALEKCQKNLLA